MAYSLLYTKCRFTKGSVSLKNLISGNLDISALNDDSGRKYYTIRVAFSEKDVLTIYKNSINELMEELPDIISSAIDARIVKNAQPLN